jgi:aminoglycoside 6'-N-acetyltransferase I
MPQTYLRHALPSDAASWEKLRCLLWPDGASDHGPEIASFFDETLTEPAAVLVVETSSDGIVAIAELSIRTDLPGYEGKRVGYVEGLYVLPELRGQGIARKLLRESRTWAREQECVAFASDRSERIIIDKDFLSHSHT